MPCCRRAQSLLQSHVVDSARLGVLLDQAEGMIALRDALDSEHSHAPPDVATSVAAAATAGGTLSRDDARREDGVSARGGAMRTQCGVWHTAATHSRSLQTPARRPRLARARRAWGPRWTLVCGMEPKAAAAAADRATQQRTGLPLQRASYGRRLLRGARGATNGTLVPRRSVGRRRMPKRPARSTRPRTPSAPSSRARMRR